MRYLQYLIALALLVHAADQSGLAVAVADLTGAGLKPEETILLSDRFRAELVATGGFAVMERAQMDAILKEQGFQQSGACTSDQCLVQVGQLLGVEKLVTGTIGKLGNTYMLNARLIDIQTGRIDRSVSEDCSGEIESLLPVLGTVARRLADTESVDATSSSSTAISARRPSSSSANWRVQLGGLRTDASDTWQARVFQSAKDRDDVTEQDDEMEYYSGLSLEFQYLVIPHVFIDMELWYGQTGHKELHWSGEGAVASQVDNTSEWDASEGSVALGIGAFYGERWRIRTRAGLLLLRHLATVRYKAIEGLASAGSLFSTTLPGTLLSDPITLALDREFRLSGISAGAQVAVAGEYRGKRGLGVGLEVGYVVAKLSQPTVTSNGESYVLVDIGSNDTQALIPKSLLSLSAYKRADLDLKQSRTDLYLFYEF